LTLWPLVRDPGLVKGLVGSFSIEPLRWIQSPQLAMLCVVIPLVWAASGPGCIIYLAALKGVSDDLYEAAEIDGAGFWHKVVYIVLPRMKFLIVIQFIAAVIGAFKGGTDYILALTGGGPNGATTILALEIFFRSFLGLDFGIGTAMAWILGALLIGFTAWQLKLLSNAEFSGGK
jgi:multiple sugar transport system permease protein